MIRPATPADAPSLGKVLGDWVRETGWMPVLHTFDEDQGFLANLIEEAEVWCDEAATGFIARRDETIPALYLAPAARGQGLGTALLSQAKQDRDHLTLWTFEANHPARRFYGRHGFTEAERTDGARNDERLPDIRMGWSRT